ncbi:MAG: type II secretion system F family protein [Phycisphaerae bacterium]|nr:type II secretion system F family protein [Phycisphaerae bacterium]
MGVYIYKGLDAAGARRCGTLTADTPTEGREHLRAQGWRIERFDPARGAGRNGRTSLADLTSWTRFASRSRRETRVADFARELAMLLRAAVPLAEALDVLIQQTTHRRWQIVLRDVRERVVGGASLADALREHATWFEGVFLSAVTVGQKAGTLDQALTQLGGFLRERTKLAARVTAALAYPMILVTLGCGVTIFLMTFVIPQLLRVLETNGRPLPAPTALLKQISDALVVGWPWILTGLGLLAVGTSTLLRTRRGRRVAQALLLRTPLLGTLLKKTLVARFAQQASLLLGTGVPFTEAIALIRGGTRNLVLAEELAAVEEAVRAGSDVAPALANSRVFPPLVVHLVAVGQSAGELPEMLEALRQDYETEVSLALSRFTAAIEPLLIVVIAAGVGFVILATILPILDVTRMLR